MSEPALSAKEQAKKALLEGDLSIAAISAATGLSEASVRGLKGALVRAGLLESTRKKTPKKSSEPDDEGSDVELSNEEDHLRYILETAKISKKDVPGILELVDDYGFDAEGIYRALEDQNIRKAIRKKVLTRWATRTGDELPQWLEDEMSTSRGPRERGRGRMMSREEWEEKNQISNLSEQVKELKNMIKDGGGLGGGLTGSQPGARYREVRTPIDRAGNPCDPQKAHSVRYERIPLGGEGGDVQALRKEISDLKERLFNDQIQGLSAQVQELRDRGGSDVGAIVSGVKDVLTSWSESEGGPLARAASPLVDAFGRRVLESYEGMGGPLTEEMKDPGEGTPENLVERLRGEGLVSNLRRKKGGGYAPG